MNMIEDIWKFDLCTGCGSCVGICPTNALRMHKHIKKGIYFPRLRDREDCTECGLCVEVCPGLRLNLNELNRFVFGKVPDDALLGNYINFYVGHSIDEKIRRNATSGGLVTSLLIFALDEGIIDRAIVTRMKKNNPLEPEVLVAKTTDDIFSASKSKYCPVPLNTVIKEASSVKGRFAVVGLPCHIHGIRKAEIVNKRLRERMVFHVGLFCSHSVSFLGTRFLLQRMGVHGEDVVKLDYRGRGWPGGLTIELKNGRKKFLPLKLYWDYFFAPFFFTPLRCILCCDGVNELADISLGDAWLPELAGCSTGESIIITRTALGESILQEANSKNKVDITKVNRFDIVRSQRGMLTFKKENLRKRMTVLRQLGKKMPELTYVEGEHLKSSLRTYIGSLLTYLNVSISSREEFIRVLKHVPPTALKLYARIVTAFTMS